MLAIFALGFITGILAMITYMVYKIKQLTKEDSDLISLLEKNAPNIKEALKNKADELKKKVLSVRDRLAEVYQISLRQQELMAALDLPSSNAIHSRHKNGLGTELKELEGKKHAILNSILKDGVDPTVTVMNEAGLKEEMKLSQFVAKYNGVEPLKEGELPPAVKAKNDIEKDDIDRELENSPKKVGKFFVHTGGKPGTNH